LFNALSGSHAHVPGLSFVPATLPKLYDKPQITNG